MARTESNRDLALGEECPAFEMVDVRSGRGLGRDDIFGGIDDADGRKGLLVAFLCVHCPFVKHMEAAFSALVKEFSGKIAAVAISSNDADAHPEDAPEGMRAQAERLGWQFPYLYDEEQAAAQEFHAACTPDLYLFDQECKLVYHAQFDETRPYRESDAKAGILKDERIHRPAHGGDLRRAFDALLAGKEPLPEQHAGLGCNIKWKV